VHKEACKPNNVTDHRQAMTDAVMQLAVHEQGDSAAVSSDDRQPIDDHSASIDTAESPKEDL